MEPGNANYVPDHFKTELFDEDENSDTEELEYQHNIEVDFDDVDYEAAEEGDDDDERRTSLSPRCSPQMSPTRQSGLSSSFGNPMDLLEVTMRSRSRSRSPLRHTDSSEPAVNDIFDEYGTPLDAEDDEFLTEDAHEMCVNERRVSQRSRRRRRGRQAPGHTVNRRRAEPWVAGIPLQFIYTNDADVPPGLANMAMDVMKMREESMQRRRKREDKSGWYEKSDRESQEDDDFQDATDERGNSILEEEHLRFDWSPMESFRAEEEVFQPHRTGSVRTVDSAYEAFRSYWNDHILQLIVDQTNDYAAKISSSVFQSDWYPTNAHEIMCLFAFWMMLDIIKMPTIKSCFSMDPILKTEVFRRIFTQKRYVSLTRALHFLDNPYIDAYSSNSGHLAVSSDQLHGLRPILDHLNLKFQNNYILSKDICIHESLTLTKGSFKQYFWSNIKTFDLYECATGYLWSFLLYTDKKNNSDPNQLVQNSTTAVMKLIEPLLNKGHRLFMDNWYNLPVLARYLKRNKTDCVGTLLPNQPHVPALVTHAPLKQGQYLARHSGDMCVLSWQNIKRITMLSTCHGAHTALPRVPSKKHLRRPLFRPQMVLDYDKSMRAVSIKDQMLEPYLLERKYAKWYMRLFKRLLNCSILNARILLQSSSKADQDHLTFRLKLVDMILAKHLSHCPANRRTTASNTRSAQSLPSHFVPHDHWPVHIEQSVHDAKRHRQTRKLCAVCLREGRKSQRSPHMCAICKVPLCVVNCFKKFHSQL